MKKYLKEIIIILLQILLFYLTPLLMNADTVIGIILLLLLGTFTLTLVLNIISNLKIKYFYPLIVSVIFIPSIFIYYNESAFIHTLWYFIDSLFGMIIGTCIFKLKSRTKS